MTAEAAADEGHGTALASGGQLPQYKSYRLVAGTTQKHWALQGFWDETPIWC